MRKNTSPKIFKYSAPITEHGKVQRFTPGADYICKKPAWSLSLIDWGGPFGWESFDGLFVQTLIERLASFESMTWQEIESSTGSHWITVDKLSKAMRDRLEFRQLRDVEEIFSLRIAGVKRIFGLIHNGIFKIVWWDPHHQGCPSEKKHT